MNYELAKELKDAGFPQDGIRDGNAYVGKEVWGPWQMEELQTRRTLPQSEWIKIPTLSELIEACGEYVHLVYTPTKAVAGVLTSENFEGKTPEEAVAKLWLALNK